MTRVLVLCPDRGVPLFGPSGASAHLRGMVGAWQRTGAEVRVATPLDADARGRVHDELEALWAMHRPPRRWPRGLRTWGRLRDATDLVSRVLRDGWRPDVVWERHSALGRVHRIRAHRVVELNAPLAQEQAHRLRQPVRHRTQRREFASLRSADQVVAVSRWLAHWAVHEAGCAPDRVHHVPNGTRPQPQGNRTATRAHWGLQGVVVGFVGSLRPWHGADRLPALLDALGPRYMGLLVGSGPHPVPAHPRLLRTGRVAPGELHHLVAAMDVGLAPYRTTAPPWFCPLKVLDYRAQGVPVVGADLGDVRELIGDAGEVVATDELEAWTAAIQRQAGRHVRPHLRTWDEVLAEALPDGRWTGRPHGGNNHGQRLA